MATHKTHSPRPVTRIERVIGTALTVVAVVVAVVVLAMKL